MDKNVIRKAAADMDRLLEPARKIVSVEFLFDREEFESSDAVPLKGKMPYCVMVRKAGEGRKLKARARNFGCLGGARALGMVGLDEASSSGRFYHKLGLYRDLATAKNVQRVMTFCAHRPYGVTVKPLAECDEEPHVVIVVTNPYNAMRIVQGYTFMFGYNSGYKMAGNQAICSECTAFPFENNTINVSMLCAGTRFKARWADDEMAVGFPFNQFLPIVEGLYATLNAIEPNDRKARIEARFREAGETPPAIEYDRNYFTGLNP